MVRRYRQPLPSASVDDAHPAVEKRREDQKTEIAAVRLLARREHSTHELRRKLEGRGHATEAVDAALTKLTSKRLLSDERFVASFVHHHASRGQGPVRIRAELRQLGITEEAAGTALEQADFDWGQSAAGARRRKFGASPPKGLVERAKQTRFLQYRGFTTDQIRTALTTFASGTSPGSDEEYTSDLPSDDLDAGESASGLDFDP